MTLWCATANGPPTRLPFTDSESCWFCSSRNRPSAHPMMSHRGGVKGVTACMWWKLYSPGLFKNVSMCLMLNTRSVQLTLLAFNSKLHQLQTNKTHPNRVGWLLHSDQCYRCFPAALLSASVRTCGCAAVQQGGLTQKKSTITISGARDAYKSRAVLSIMGVESGFKSSCSY